MLFQWYFIDFKGVSHDFMAFPKLFPLRVLVAMHDEHGAGDRLELLQRLEGLWQGLEHARLAGEDHGSQPELRK